MKFVLAFLITAFAALTAFGQAPTLRIVTEVPNLPSELYYGNIKVKPLRLRPGTNIPITINDSDFFVNQQYVDFLNRFPDQSGFNFWVNEITSCNGNAACIAGQRDNVSGAFFLSIEHQETGFLVERMYKVAYGDAPAQSTLGGTHRLLVPIVRRSEFLPDTLQMSNGVVIGQPGWETVWRLIRWRLPTILCARTFHYCLSVVHDRRPICRYLKYERRQSAVIF